VGIPGDQRRRDAPDGATDDQEDGFRMTTLDPLHASERIRDEYRRYLLSTFPLRRPDLQQAFADQLDGRFPLARGPILQASAPYSPGRSVRELVDEGVLSERFLRLQPEQFPVDRPLHQHQEQAIKKAVEERRNLVVATGTGSGKTECFLFPILDGLLREADAGTLSTPGVRALLLYPMNALANDQLKRLRGLLAAFPNITFGRYVGETKHEQKRAEDDFRTRYPSEPMLPNELLSREVMQQRPPHILLTNYAMLEYLLLRSTDSTLFDGPTGEHWRYLALDEVHVYAGAQGAEVAMLLRRLRDRVNGSRRGRLQCFGTSATLGRGRQDYPELASFAEALFDEPFSWETRTLGHEDVVEATRRPLVRSDAAGRLGDDIVAGLRSRARAGADVEELAGIAGIPADPGQSVGGYLAHLLASDARVIALQARLEGGSLDLADVANDLFDGPEARKHLVDLVDLGVLAREREGDASLLPARYHFFLRALEGAFVCLHPGHDPAAPALLLSRHERCPSCLEARREAAMFELGVCRRCGSEYLVGTKTGAGQFTHATAFSSNPLRVLLGDPLVDGEDDEDQDLAGAATDKAVAATLCPSCGVLNEGSATGCNCGVTTVRVWIAVNAKDDGALRRCIACGYRAGGDPIYRFLTGLDAPVSVLATNLYQEIPASTAVETRNEVGEGRKLLVFSDSRQDAAFFAPFVERTYQRAIQRRLIAMALSNTTDEAPRTGDLVGPVVRLAEQALVLDPDDGSVTNRRSAATWLVRELLALDRRQSLEGTGVAEIRLAFPRRCEPPRPLVALGFSPDEALDLIHLLLNTVRFGGALQVLDGVDVRDREFEPRNREIAIRGDGTVNGNLAWSPAKNLNGRLDILGRIFARRGITEDPKKVLAGVWRMLVDTNGPWSKLFVTRLHADGPLWMLDAERFEFFVNDGTRAPLRCSRCKQLWWKTIAGICPSFRCDGDVVPVEDTAAVLSEHYARLYQALEPIGMAVEEHTAQWKSTKASAVQDDFVSGRINVLSCSTTFELGVDVGDVQAVLLRNMPPSPANYIQRAGRAGRRTDSAALVVTYAQRRSHDLTYFADPGKMVDGTIPPPRIILDNVPIARRHLHSVAFAAFQREAGDSRDVDEFFISEDGEPRDVQFVEWLRSHPSQLGEAAKRVMPPPVHAALGLKTWDWVEALVSIGGDEPSYGWLRRAGEEVRDDVKVLQDLVDEAAEAKQFRRASYLENVSRTIVRRPLLNFLGSRNVLPKYGFPVDVVELSLARSGEAAAANLELSRDLELAISDYAPGAVTVAGKGLWRSTGLVRRSDREWPQYEWVRCERCDTFRRGLVEASTKCGSCGSESRAASGKFVVPLYGFVGEAHEKPGETRPQRLAMRETFFGDYRDAPPEPEIVRGLAVSARFSHQGRITVLNLGPLGRGFRICSWCGFGQPIHGTKAPKQHERVDRPGKPCNGPFEHLQLGHEYFTDVLELEINAPVASGDVRSALYAVLEAAPELDVARDDIDGTLHYGAVGRPSLVLFDSVPGGAGHVQRLGRRLPELITAASRRVSSCECGEETSCYACLRGYRNQNFHDQLTRRSALAVLRSLTPPTA
jgi:ATP-dependent helicase YprA (DUF1998 family)